MARLIVPTKDEQSHRPPPPITAFFDAVLVMDKDEALRRNRLALLRRVADLAAGIVDLSKLQGF